VSELGEDRFWLGYSGGGLDSKRTEWGGVDMVESPPFLEETKRVRPDSMANSSSVSSCLIFQSRPPLSPEVGAGLL